MWKGEDLGESSNADTEKLSDLMTGVRTERMCSRVSLAEEVLHRSAEDLEEDRKAYKDIRWLIVAARANQRDSDDVFPERTGDHLWQRIHLDSTSDEIDSLSRREETVESPITRRKVLRQSRPFLRVLHR